MELSSTYRKLALTVLLVLGGMCAAPAAAGAQTQLLFLGISQNGKPNQVMAHAIQLRLRGLDFMVTHPKAIPDPLCERVDCVVAALTREPVNLAMAGRILKTDRACLATLWLVAGRSKKRPIEHDVACRADWKDAELGANLANEAAEVIDDYLRNEEPAPSQINTAISLNTPVIPNTKSSSTNIRLKKNLLLGGIGTLLAISMTTTIALIANGPMKTGDIQAGLLRPETIAASAISGAAAASIAFIAIK